MRKITIILMLCLVSLALVIPAGAQDATTTPDAELSEDATEQVAAPEDSGQIINLRLAYLATDGPVLQPYLNEMPSNIQVLGAPVVSGWVQVNTNTSLSFVPEGSDAPVLGPFDLSGGTTPWMTLAIVGSAQNNTLRAVSFNENIGPLPPGCAQVTVFHGLEDGDSVNLVTGDGTLVGTNLTFPGGTGASMAEEAGQTVSFNNCPEDQPQSEAQTAAADRAAGPLTCRALGTAAAVTSQQNQPQAEATETLEGEDASDSSSQPDAQAATQPAASTSTTSGAGQSFANCASTFLVPAGSLNFQGVSEDATAMALFDVADMQIETNTYHFVALSGTSDSPLVTFQTLGEPQLAGQAGFQPPQDMELPGDADQDAAGDSDMTDQAGEVGQAEEDNQSDGS